MNDSNKTTGLLPLLLTIVISCGEGAGSANPGPSAEEMDEVARARCEQAVVECENVPDDVTVEGCFENQRKGYEASPECVASFYLDECLIGLTCEEFPPMLIPEGDCREEIEEYSRVSPCIGQ